MWFVEILAAGAAEPYVGVCGGLLQRIISKIHLNVQEGVHVTVQTEVRYRKASKYMETMSPLLLFVAIDTCVCVCL